MKWVNHSATAICVAIAVTGHPIISAAAAITSSLPDKIEIFIPFSRHRGISHDPVFWFPMIVTLLALPIVFANAPLASGIFKHLAVGSAMGVAMHLITDSLSVSGIPVFRKYRLAGKLYKTTNISEYIVSLGICLPSLCIAYMAGNLNAVSQANEIVRLLK